MTGAELIPSLVVGDTEIVCGKLKMGKGFLKPNFEALPKPEFFNPIMVYLAS